MVALSFCVALASASVIDEFKSFKAKHNKVYADEAEVSESKCLWNHRYGQLLFLRFFHQKFESMIWFLCRKRETELLEIV